MPNLDSLIAYYVNRLLWEYKLPKAQQTIAITVKQIIADGILFQIQDGYTLGSAIGKQLDVLGKYIGLSRMIGDPTPLPFFGFVSYDGIGDNTNGLTDYESNVNQDVVFYDYDYNQQNVTALSDTAYLYMLFLKIALNTGDMTLYGIQNILADTLDGRVRVVDNADMSLTYYVGTNIPVTPTVLTPYLPKPMGVRIANVIVQSNLVTGDGANVVTGDGDQIVLGNL